MSPNFTQDRLVYVYFSTASDNRIATVTCTTEQAQGKRRQGLCPASADAHAQRGGRLAFDEKQDPAAQDKGSLGGKILRMTTAGQPDPRATRSGPSSGVMATATFRASRAGPGGPLWASEFGDKLAIS